MTEEKVVTTKKKTSVRKKGTAKKKSAAKKKTTTKTPTSAKNRKAATISRHAFTDKLKQDLKSTKEALSVVKAAASEELKLARIAAKDEIAVLKDHIVKNKKSMPLFDTAQFAADLERHFMEMWNGYLDENRD